MAPVRMENRVALGGENMYPPHRRPALSYVKMTLTRVLSRPTPRLSWVQVLHVGC